MPVLPNPKHEAFAQGVAKGLSQVEAYKRAGYKPHDANAARMIGDDRIKARVAELQAKAAQKTVDAISFEATDMFRRLEDEIAAAKAAGAHTAVMKGREMMLQSFGYLDSPTLTHEHVRGQALTPKEAETVADDIATSNVVRFGKAIGELRKRAG